MIAMTVDDTTLGLLAGVFGVEPEAANVAILADRLEEIARLDLKWILLGHCPQCGGQLREQRKKDGDAIYSSLLGEPYMVCRRCGEEDVDATKSKKELAQTRINRVARLLGLKRCDASKHQKLLGLTGARHWIAAGDCPKCGGLGLVRP